MCQCSSSIFWCYWTFRLFCSSTFHCIVHWMRCVLLVVQAKANDSTELFSFKFKYHRAITWLRWVQYSFCKSILLQHLLSKNFCYSYEALFSFYLIYVYAVCPLFEFNNFRNDENSNNQIVNIFHNVKGFLGK